MKKNIIITFLILFIFKLLLSYLEYRGNSSPELHDEILRYFTQSDIIKGEAYSKNGALVSIIKSITLAAFILIMSFSTFSGRLEKFCSDMAGNRFFLASFYYIAIFYFILTLINLPFNFYLSFIKEHSFGFSNMSAGFWFLTRAKWFMIYLIFISMFGSMALMAIKKFRFYSVFIVPVGGLVIGLAMIIIYPLVILPLFYEIKTIENPSLEKRIVETVRKSGITVDKIYVVKESDYSKHTNAFFIGFGNHKRIYLYDNLIKNNGESEVISILAHEIGHWVYNHNIKGIMIGFFLSLGGFLIIYYCAKRMQVESDYLKSELHSPTMIPFYLLLFIILSVITDPLENIISREMEMRADYYSLQITDDPDSFISAEIKLARDNSSRLNKHPFPAFFRNSHPAAIERIRMAEIFKNNKNMKE